MNVSSVNANTPGQINDPNNFRTRFEQAMGPVAQLFGESTSQLQQDLSTPGASLASLAQSKGIDETSLESAIKQGLQQSAPAGSTPLSDTQLSNIANRIAHHKHGGHHHHQVQAVDTGTDPNATSSATGVGQFSPSQQIDQAV